MAAPFAYALLCAGASRGPLPRGAGFRSCDARFAILMAFELSEPPAPRGMAIVESLGGRWAAALEFAERRRARSVPAMSLGERAWRSENAYRSRMEIGELCAGLPDGGPALGSWAREAESRLRAAMLGFAAESGREPFLVLQTEPTARDASAEPLSALDFAEMLGPDPQRSVEAAKAMDALDALAERELLGRRCAAAPPARRRAL